MFVLMIGLALVTAVFYLAVVCIILIFKPRVQATAFGMSLGTAYVIKLFEPLISSTNPYWVSMIFIILFNAFAAFTSYSIRYSPPPPNDQKH